MNIAVPIHLRLTVYDHVLNPLLQCVYFLEVMIKYVLLYLNGAETWIYLVLVWLAVSLVYCMYGDIKVPCLTPGSGKIED